MDAVRAERIGELVRVAHDRRRPARDQQPRQLADHQLGRLDVHVRVDEPGGEPAPAPVDARPAVVRPDAGEPPVGDRDVALEPLPREGAEDLSALDDDVRLHLATSDGQQPRGREVVEHPGDSSVQAKSAARATNGRSGPQRAGLTPNVADLSPNVADRSQRQ